MSHALNYRLHLDRTAGAIYGSTCHCSDFGGSRLQEPRKFSDVSLDSPGYERGADPYVMKELRNYIQKLGERYLPPGQQLQIEIRNIDLAGRYEPWRPNAYEARFMRDITWPSIDLHYVLKQNGQFVSQVDARVMDQLYLQRPGRANRSDRLYSWVLSSVNQKPS